MGNKEKRVYSDGNIEKHIYDYLINHDGNSEDIIEAIPEGAVFHNFVSARENLLRWYPFKKNCCILEIGAGMGALTPFLASVCERVVALEPSTSRADIISLRCKKYPNVQVAVQSLDDYSDETKFDYVTLIGVLEYAGIYNEGENPWQAMLSKAREYLKPDGKLLLAIENKFGLKYWCGASEDHTGIPFDSLNDYITSNGATGRYAGSKGVRTFSKDELEKLLKDSGFIQNKFYYPLPDYKFPMLVLSDGSESADTLVCDIKFTYPDESILVANESKLYPQIIRNGALGFFANSYFIEASNTVDEECKIVTATIKRDYKTQYRILTTIDSDYVVRFPTSMESRTHIQQLIENTRSLQYMGIPCVTQEEYQNIKTRAKKINAPRADAIFKNSVENNNTSLALNMIDKLRNYLLKSSESHEQNGEVILKTGYLDMTFRNSFWNNNDLLFYDQEWVGENIPLNYIVYRAIKYAMVHTSESCSNFYYAYCGITQNDIERFEGLEDRFLHSLMDRQNCAWFDRAMYQTELTLDSIIENKLICKEAHIQQLIQSERGLQSNLQCKEGHIELLLQSERDLLAENEKKAANIRQLQYDLGYQTSMVDHLRQSEAELRKQLEEARSTINQLQYELGSKVSEKHLPQ